MAFREFITSSEKKVLAGKDAEQNEELVKQFIGKGNKIFHSSKPGSPFCVIKAQASRVDSASLKEAAEFWAAFSKAFKQGSKSIEVHSFLKEDVYKTKAMPQGTFGVRKLQRKFSVKPELAIGLKENELQCSPPSALDKVLLPLRYSDRAIPKEQAAAKISSALEKKGIKTSAERIMQLIPPQGFGI